MFQIASNLNPNIFEPHLACLHDRGAFFKEVKVSGIPVHVIPYIQYTGSSLSRFLHAVKVSRTFKKERFDIIHSFHYASEHYEALAAKFSGAKWVFTKKNMSWGHGRLHTWTLRSSLADGIVLLNHDMQKRFYPTTENVKVIPRGIDPEEFQIRKPSLALKAELGLEVDDQVVLCVANLIPVKNVEVLIDAFQQLEAGPRVKLLLVGNDKSEYADSLKLRAGENSNIIFTGKRNDVKELETIATVFVMPSKMEGGPVATMEAMAAGIPVLGSAAPGIRDQLSPMPDQLFPPDDATMLANKLHWMLTMSPTERQDIIDQQLQRVRQRYIVEHQVRDHEDFYLSIMGRDDKLLNRNIDGR